MHPATGTWGFYPASGARNTEGRCAHGPKMTPANLSTSLPFWDTRPAWPTPSGRCTALASVCMAGVWTSWIVILVVCLVYLLAHTRTISCSAWLKTRHDLSRCIFSMFLPQSNRSERRWRRLPSLKLHLSLWWESWVTFRRCAAYAPWKPSSPSMWAMSAGADSTKTGEWNWNGKWISHSFSIERISC